MSIREEFEMREKNFMSPFGCLSSETRGRDIEESSCPVRTAFQLDRDRIVYSNGFRRLKHKTQVFLSPLGDDYRTRLTHTLEVAQMARAMARALFLNEDLAEHNEQSLRVVEILENNGKGLNLTYEVRDGISKHSKGFGKIIPEDAAEMACTYEGRIVRIADIMAYLNHDLEDAIRSEVIRTTQVPPMCIKILGHSHSERATVMIRDLISASEVRDGDLRLQMTDDVYAAMIELRQFLYENVYRSDRVHKDFEKAKKILSELYSYFLENDKILEQKLIELKMDRCYNSHSKKRTVCDVIASMTDRYALNLYKKIFFPSPLV
jgi:dGTPase